MDMVFEWDDKKDAIMAIVTSRLKAGSTPSDEVVARMKEAARYPVTFDEDCPELTDAQLSEFKPVNPELHVNPKFFKPKKKQIALEPNAKGKMLA